MTHLRRDDNLITDTARRHPLANVQLRGFVLVVVRGVDEVASSLEERVKKLEAGLLGHETHPELVPLVANAHCPKAEWRDVHAGGGGELAVEAELRGRGRSGRKAGHSVSVCCCVRLLVGESKRYDNLCCRNGSLYTLRSCEALRSV